MLGPPLPGGLPEIAAHSSQRAQSQDFPEKPGARGAACPAGTSSMLACARLLRLRVPAWPRWLCLQWGAQHPSGPQRAARRRQVGRWDGKAVFSRRSPWLGMGTYQGSVTRMCSCMCKAFTVVPCCRCVLTLAGASGITLGQGLSLAPAAGSQAWECPPAPGQSLTCFSEVLDQPTHSQSTRRGGDKSGTTGSGTPCAGCPGSQPSAQGSRV